MATKKVETKKTTTKTSVAAKPATAEKTTAKKVEAKKEAPAKKDTGIKVYHVSKREKDGKWQVFIRGSDKVIKLFDTKVEAEEYCTKMAINQGATLQVHKSKGVNKGKISKAIVKGKK